MGRNGCEGEWHMLNGWAFLSDENTTPLARKRNVDPQVAPAQAVSGLIPVHSAPKASVGTWLQAEFTSMPDIHSSTLTWGHYAATLYHSIEIEAHSVQTALLLGSRATVAWHSP